MRFVLNRNAGAVLAGLMLCACLSRADHGELDAREPSGPSALVPAEKAPAQAEATPDPQAFGTGAWTSFRNGPQLRGIAGSSLPAQLDLLWQIPVTDGVTATAAIVGDHVYAGTFGGELLCLKRRTGEKVWTYLSKPRDKPNAFLPAFKASPTVTEDSLYLGDEDGVFHAVDRETGESRWRFQTQGEIISSATIVGENILFGSYDNSLYCLTKSDGTQVWKFETDGYVNCTPAVAGNLTFVTGCDEHLRAIDISTGKQVFDMPLATYLIASPAVVPDENMLYVGTYASEVIAVNLKDQQVTWRYKDGEREFPYHSSAAVTERYVVVGGRDKQVHCIDRQSGEGIWKFATRARVDSSPVIVGERVFIGSGDGNVYGFELASGKPTWKHNLGKPITASPAVGEGCLVIGTEAADGLLCCFGAKSP